MPFNIDETTTIEDIKQYLKTNNLQKKSFYF